MPELLKKVQQPAINVMNMGRISVMQSLIGKVFGMLTVTGSADPVNGRARVTYSCACGSVGARRSDQIINAVSCGCVRIAKAAAMSSARLVDLTGQRFGRLVAVHRVDGAGRVRWKCACDCGSESTVMAENLRSGNTCSCGCARSSGDVVRPEGLRARKNEAVKKRYREDPKFAIDARVRAAIHKHLRSHGQEKEGRPSNILGYTSRDLEARLLETMPDGYTWADFLAGKLHIDHIIPLSAFNFSKLTDLDFRRAWALGNLRLMVDTDNIKKSNKLDAPFQPSLRF